MSRRLISQYVIGRVRSRFWWRRVTRQPGNVLIVGAYVTLNGDTFYTDPFYSGPRERAPGGNRQSACQYNIIVTPKDKLDAHSP